MSALFFAQVGKHPTGQIGSSDRAPALREQAPAVFRGMQDGFGIVPDIELWNLTADIPGHPVHSTLSRQTIEAAGYYVPASRPAELPTVGNWPVALVALEVVPHPSGGFTIAEPFDATRSTCRIYTGWWSNRKAAQAALDAKFS